MNAKNCEIKNDDEIAGAQAFSTFMLFLYARFSRVLASVEKYM
jgi:hypothetical protein